MPIKNELTADQAMNLLKTRNSNFTGDSLTADESDRTRRAYGEKEGQAPYAIILSCAGSRVAPEYIFDSGLGNIFVVRVAGNVASVEGIASIEYAVANLNTNLIIVMGHQKCGAVGAALQGGDNGHNLNVLLAQITPAVAKCRAGGNDDVNTVVKKNAELNAALLLEKSPILTEMAKTRLRIVPAYYNLGTGVVEFDDAHSLGV